MTITKTGKDPARILVKKGSEQWEVTEDELEKLPANVRPLVEEMLGRRLGIEPFRIEVGPPEAPRRLRLRSDEPGQEEGRIETRLKKLESRLEKLLERLDERGTPQEKGESAGEQEPDEKEEKTERN
jgi:hypothetical protein